MNLTPEQFWPWWLGALALGLVATVHLWASGRLMGVSGLYARVLRPRAELAAERRERALGNETQLRLALMEQTLEEMRGVELPPEVLEEAEAELAALRGQLGAGSGGGSGAGLREVGRTPMSGVVVFLGCIFLGGMLGKLFSAEGLSLEWAPSGRFVELFGAGWAPFVALIGGGLLVGVGTRIAGGCTSGHGLSGCARLQPGSLVATACFFGTGVVTSLLLARVLA